MLKKYSNLNTNLLKWRLCSLFCYPDINECEAVPSVCHSDAVCTDSDGSYECTCKEGYSGNGINCTGNIIHNELYLDFNAQYCMYEHFCGVLALLLQILMSAQSCLLVMSMLIVQIQRAALTVNVFLDTQEME